MVFHTNNFLESNGLEGMAGGKVAGGRMAGKVADGIFISLINVN